jgi:hypothetical protein
MSKFVFEKVVKRRELMMIKRVRNIIAH